MMKKNLILVLLMVTLFCSCVHQWPESSPAQVDLAITFNTEMTYNKTVPFPEGTKSDQTLSIDPVYFEPDFSDHEKYDVRYIVEAYRLLNDGSYSREAVNRWTFFHKDARVLDDHVFTVFVDEGRYVFRAWADFVEAGKTQDLHWHTANWKSGIRLNTEDGYDGTDDWRDAYAGSVEVEAVRYGAIAEPVTALIHMNRPQGKYFFVTNDLQEFITKVIASKAEDDTKAPEFNLEEYTFEVTYTSFVPNSYNIHTDRANDSAPTARYEASLTQVDENRAIMGFDYVITGTQGSTSVKVGLTLKHEDGTVLAEHANVNIPVKANQYTVVEGRFLMQESSGGVSIDPGFAGPDIIVPVY